MARKKKRAEVAGFDAAPQAPKRLTPADVQEKVFRTTMARRGYNEQDVDEFLDRMTEELALLHEENKRLREQAGAGVGSTEGLEQAELKAAEMVRQAREYAAQVKAEAENSSGASAPPASFLIRERDFLQRLASAIQEHAEALKADARRGKAAEAAAPPAPERVATDAPETEPGGAIRGAHEGLDAAPIDAPPAGADTWPLEDTQAHDPVLEEWDGGVAGGPGEEAYQGGDVFVDQPEKEPRRQGGEEPSLRELFWGEE